ncbi:proteasome assembly chaperone family protein [Candidatus Hodarchaeum mangrovi]
MTHLYSDDFEIRNVTEIDLSGGTLIECFPSISSLALIVANILLEADGRPENWKYDQVAVGDSNQLPTICVVYYNKPKFPIRIYANKETKNALLVSEIPQYPPITREIGRKIFQWAKEKEIERIVSIDGFLSDYTDSPQELPMRVFGVGTTDKCRTELKSKRVKLLDQGVIKGLSAVLLNEGWFNKSDVIVLLGEVRQHYPEIRTAARLIEVLNLLVPHLNVHIEPILAQAEKIEQLAVSMRDQATAALEPSKDFDKTYI